jgi:pyruvate dehydrogenase complex dehydrogenase (E1) component
MKKLDILTKAMYDRPALKLDIEGHVDIERDKEGLKNYLVQKKIKVQKLNEMIKKGLPVVPIDEVKVEQQEYEKYLTMAYKTEKFAKPRTTVGFTKSLPVPEMEKLMLTHTVVNDEDLRTLATQRAMNTKDLILKSGKVTPDRVFIIEPKTLSPEKKEKLKDSRIDFKLK